MTCTHPFSIVDPETERYFAVPCGKCVACKIQRAKEWAVRLMHESDFHKKKCFLTLTYADEAFKEGRAPEYLSKKTLIDFMKRLRNCYPAKTIKYYATGEYGEKNGRPHYHMILFGSYEPEEFYQDIWGLGNVYVGEVTYDSCRYVADYIQKKLYGDDYLKKIGKDTKQPFSIMSKKIGYDYAVKNKDQINFMDNITIYGEPVGIPRYYQKVIDYDPEKLRKKAVEREIEQREMYQKKGYNKQLMEIRLAQRKKQREKNIIARKKIKNKGSL